MLEHQTAATIALAAFAAIQGMGIWTRMIVAYKQYKLDKAKFDYRKMLDEKRNMQ